MSFGFQIFDSNGNLTLNGERQGFVLIDIIRVSPNDSGSRSYNDIGGLSLITTQSPQEPPITTRAALLAFNVVNVSASAGVVTWSPRFQQGTLYNVDIYVFAS